MEGEASQPKAQLLHLHNRAFAGTFRPFSGAARPASRPTQARRKDVMNYSASSPGLVGRFWAMPWKIRAPALIVALLVLFYVVTLSLNLFNYSVGERTGVLSKLSTKGFVCWTMEGELAQPSFSRSSAFGTKPGAPVDNTFYFSVPDPEVRKELEKVSPGSAVSLQYEQKVFSMDWPLPGLCRRRTQFEITGVRAAPAYQPEPFPSRPEP
jgi:hypothetical protein